jgi:hypothetical protein
MNLNQNQIKQMREWVMDCVWADVDPEEVELLSDAEIIRGVKRYYDGGLSQFLADCAGI